MIAFSKLSSMPVKHLFTVDVEEYFQVNAFEDVAPRDRWDSFPSRVRASLDLVFDLLATHDVRGTFFTLGWIASRHPDLVRAIADAGHEVASHGWWHRRVTTLDPEQFRQDVRDSKALLEQVSGSRVLGFRAPSFSIIPGYEWALEILAEEGYAYDSSIFPIRRPGYGYPGAAVRPHSHRLAAGELHEFPLATTTIAGVRVPAAGGGYLRQLPFALIRRAFREHDDAGVPGVFYIHPWELDPEQPRLEVSRLTRARHYRGLDRTRSLVARLLDEFRFTSIAAHLEETQSPTLTGGTPHGAHG